MLLLTFKRHREILDRNYTVKVNNELWTKGYQAKRRDGNVASIIHMSNFPLKFRTQDLIPITLRLYMGVISYSEERMNVKP